MFDIIYISILTFRKREQISNKCHLTNQYRMTLLKNVKKVVESVKVKGGKVGDVAEMQPPVPILTSLEGSVPVLVVKVEITVEQARQLVCFPVLIIFTF